jgi:hypothetical protein
MLQHIDSNIPTESNPTEPESHFQNTNSEVSSLPLAGNESSHQPLNTSGNAEYSLDNTSTTLTQNLVATQPNFLSNDSTTQTTFQSNTENTQLLNNNNATTQSNPLPTQQPSDNTIQPNYLSNVSTTQTTFQSSITIPPPLTTQTQTLPNSSSQPITTTTTTSTLQQNYPATIRTQNSGGYITPPFISQSFQQPSYPYTQSSYIQNYQTNFPTQPGGYPQSTGYSSTFPTPQPYSTPTNTSTQHNTNYNYHNYNPQTGFNMAHPGVVNYANYSGTYGSSSTIPNTYQSEYRSQIVNDGGADKSELKEVLISSDSVIKVTDNTEHVIQKRLLYAIAVILLIAWALGFFVYSAGSLIHILLVIAIVAILFRVIRGERV